MNPHRDPTVPPGDRPLHRWERLGLCLVALFLVTFGGLVLLRGAFQHNRKTDFGVYARAAYAVRVGAPIYAADTCDDNGWHYCYPPPFAIVMVPLADPYRWVTDRGGYLPYWVSVAVWYALGVAFAATACHLFAAAALPDAARFSRRWWYARTAPCYLCAAGIGFTLSRGQVNTLALALLAAAFAALSRGRPTRGGAWLAAAACLKLIPAYLALYPLVRGQWRAGVGFALGCALLLFALPALAWGPAGALREGRLFVELVIAPGSLGGGDKTRERELTGAGATDSLSFQSAAQNLLHPEDWFRKFGPADALPVGDPRARHFHWACAAAMTALTCAVGLFRTRDAPADQLLLFGAFCAGMLHSTPVSHVHYFCYAYPLLAGLWIHSVAASPGRATPPPALLAGLVAWAALAGFLLLDNPAATVLRKCGGGLAATLALWGVALARLSRAWRAEQAQTAASRTLTRPA